MKFEIVDETGTATAPIAMLQADEVWAFHGISE